MTSEGERAQHWAQLGNGMESALYWRLLGVRVEETPVVTVGCGCHSAPISSPLAPVASTPGR